MKSFRVQLLTAHWLECSQPHVQRNIRDLNTSVAARVQNLRREVQARGRRRDRAGLARKYSLIPFPIVRPIAPLDIRRQRYMADPLQDVIDIAIQVKPDRSLAILAASNDLGLDIVESNPLASTHFATGMH